MKEFSPVQNHKSRDQEVEHQRPTKKRAEVAAGALSLLALTACTGGSGNTNSSGSTTIVISQSPKGSTAETPGIRCDPPVIKLGVADKKRRSIGISLSNISDNLPKSWYRQAIYRIFTMDPEGNLTPFTTTSAGIYEIDEIDKLPTNTRILIQAGVFAEASTTQTPSSVPSSEQLTKMAATAYLCDGTTEITS